MLVQSTIENSQQLLRSSLPTRLDNMPKHDNSDDEFDLDHPSQVARTQERIPSKQIRKIKLSDVQHTTIIDVWHDNLEKELREIIALIEEFKVIALDTEFPGIQLVPLKVVNEEDFEYKMIRESVRNSKIIQIGFSISNEAGEVPADRPFSWQFNFNFDHKQDQIHEESLKLLENAGIDFNELKLRGIQREIFADLISESDLILNEEIKWVVFHGGYDFAYLLQMLYGSTIPESADLFYNLLNCFFPRIYDVKYLMQPIDTIRERGLDRVARHLFLHRIGPKHQAGSDSLLTLSVFLKLRDDNLVDIEANVNTIYGIGHGFVAPKLRDYLSPYKKQYAAQYEAAQNLPTTSSISSSSSSATSSTASLSASAISTPPQLTAATMPLLPSLPNPLFSTPFLPILQNMHDFHQQRNFGTNPTLLPHKLFENFQQNHASNKFNLSMMQPLMAAVAALQAQQFSQQPAHHNHQIPHSHHIHNNNNSHHNHHSYTSHSQQSQQQQSHSSTHSHNAHHPHHPTEKHHKRKHGHK